MPVADGGDGTLDAAVAAGYTARARCGWPARPASRSTPAYAVRDGVAVVELADACGLARLPGGQLAPLTASSGGLGEVIARRAGRGLPAARARRSAAAPAPTAAPACWPRSAPGSSTPTARRCRRVAAASRGSDRVDLSGLHPALAQAEVRARQRRRQPAARPARRGRGLRAAEGRDARRRRAARRRAAALVRAGRRARGASSRHVRASGGGRARRRRRRRGRLRRARRPRRRRPAGHRAAARADRLPRSAAPARTWSSPARARWTSRPCTARRRPGSPPRPARRASPWSPSPAETC